MKFDLDDFWSCGEEVLLWLGSAVGVGFVLFLILTIIAVWTKMLFWIWIEVIL